MGFVRANVIPILKEHKRRPFSGRLLYLGAPDVYFAHESLVEMAATVHVQPKVSGLVAGPTAPHLKAKCYLSGQTLFGSMGF